jgi:hypothetical protein
MYAVDMFLLLISLPSNLPVDGMLRDLSRLPPMCIYIYTPTITSLSCVCVYDINLCMYALCKQQHAMLPWKCY